MTLPVPESQQQYGSVLTVLGENAEQNGKLLNKQLEITHMAIGDANDLYVQPDRKQTALVNELARIEVNSVDVLQPTPDSVPMLKVEAILPDEVNDIVIREFAAVATFNGQTYFHAIGNCARVYVPPPVNNGNVNTPVTLEMIFVITSAEPIVEIDPHVVTASREWVNKNIEFASSDLLGGNIWPTNSKYSIKVNDVVDDDCDYFRISGKTCHLVPSPSIGNVVKEINPDKQEVVFTNPDLVSIYYPVSAENTVKLSSFGAVKSQTPDLLIKSINEAALKKAVEALKIYRGDIVEAAGEIILDGIYSIRQFSTDVTLRNVKLRGRSEWLDGLILDDDSQGIDALFNFESCFIFSDSAYKSFFVKGVIPAAGETGQALFMAGTQDWKNINVCGFNENIKAYKGTGQLLNSSFKKIRTWCSKTSCIDFTSTGKHTTCTFEDWYITNCSGQGHIISDISHSKWNNIIHELCGVALRVRGNDIGNVYERFYFERNVNPYELTQCFGQRISWTTINNTNSGSETINKQVFGYLNRPIVFGQDQSIRAESFKIPYLNPDDPDIAKGVESIDIVKTMSVSQPQGLAVKGIPKTKGLTSEAGLILSNEQKIMHTFSVAFLEDGTAAAPDSVISVSKVDVGSYKLTASTGLQIADIRPSAIQPPNGVPVHCQLVGENAAAINALVSFGGVTTFRIYTYNILTGERVDTSVMLNIMGRLNGEVAQ
ncbi:phage tail-collar fiber domain-containing protein [Photobacterium alginatilyticum]|uniref:Phage tail fibre protein N-terminal domain-containing protein n=1 Tax=Photobacterium alginatilyticum TaxID=1775171 RepID=A0ABW9YLF6_9GAMM|nr:phage tail protein [Photobacterium alginatilyticum]NBI54646.1 hypothetical protein [Photobacterium alginatilyticum]